MSQRHGAQHGLFHITTNARGRIPWCTVGDIPQIIIDNLFMTRNMQSAQLHAFCILPDHVHIIMSPGMKGLSAFVHSWKRNTMRDVRRLLPTNTAHSCPVAEVGENDSHHVVEVGMHNPCPVAEVRNLRVNKHENSHDVGRGRYGSSAADITEIDQSLVCWQKSFHDERIRDGNQRSTALAYVQGNTVKHGLVTNITDWPWTSLHFPELLDPMEMWLG